MPAPPEFLAAWSAETERLRRLQEAEAAGHSRRYRLGRQFGRDCLYHTRRGAACGCVDCAAGYGSDVTGRQATPEDCYRCREGVLGQGAGERGARGARDGPRFAPGRTATTAAQPQRSCGVRRSQRSGLG